MKLAVVFPGQGSQSVGMLSALADHYAEVRETFEEASEALGYDLWQVSQSGPEEQLNSTECTQPAMLTAGFSVWRVWCKRGGRRPQVLAGHSLGEYTALVCAGALTFREAVEVVRDRGRFMQAAVPHGVGAVAAVLGLDDGAVAAVCEEAAGDEVVRPVNFNAPGQVVIAGHAAAVERAIERAKTDGARRAVVLPLSVPVHSPLMEPAAERFAERLREVDFSAPRLPVIANVDVKPHGSRESIRESLVRQLYSPVRWSETVAYLDAEGVAQVVECGPGKVLTGLSRRTARRMPAHPVFDPESLDAALAAAADG